MVIEWYPWFIEPSKPTIKMRHICTFFIQKYIFLAKHLVNSKKSSNFAADFGRNEAQMAESVDALVSNTSRFTPVPVRPRLWVQSKIKFNYPTKIGKQYICFPILRGRMAASLIRKANCFSQAHSDEGHAEDLNIRYHSERANCLERKRKGGVCNDHSSSERR